MVISELALQYDLFTGELVDNRSSYQKKKDFERSAPSQLQMFSTPDVIQFGIRPKSAYKEWIDQATLSPLVLEIEDKRTLEEVERDLIREAEKQTIPLFADTLEPQLTKLKTAPPLQEFQRSGTIFAYSSDLSVKGLRAVLRAKSITVRTRLQRSDSFGNFDR